MIDMLANEFSNGTTTLFVIVPIPENWPSTYPDPHVPGLFACGTPNIPVCTHLKPPMAAGFLTRHRFPDRHDPIADALVLANDPRVSTLSGALQSRIPYPALTRRTKGDKRQRGVGIRP